MGAEGFFVGVEGACDNFGPIERVSASAVGRFGT